MANQQIHRKHCKRYNHPNNANELTFSCYKGMKLLKSERACSNLAESINNACEKLDFSVIAYVFMPTHAHLLVATRKNEYSISEFLKSVKQSVARKEINYFRKNKQEMLKYMATGQKHDKNRFWQDGGGYDRNIVRSETLKHSINYIHNNPVRAELVEDAREWKWSSAGFWLENRQGVIPIDISWLSPW